MARIISSRQRWLLPTAILVATALAAVVPFALTSAAFSAFTGSWRAPASCRNRRSGRAEKCGRKAVEFLTNEAAYKALGLDSKSRLDDKELKKAFRQAASKSHPDVEGGSIDKFDRVKSAYEFLAGGKGEDTSSYTKAYSNYENFQSAYSTARVWDEGVPQNGPWGGSMPEGAEAVPGGGVRYGNYYEGSPRGAPRYGDYSDVRPEKGQGGFAQLGGLVGTSLAVALFCGIMVPLVVNNNGAVNPENPIQTAVRERVEERTAQASALKQRLEAMGGIRGTQYLFGASVAELQKTQAPVVLFGSQKAADAEGIATQILSFLNDKDNSATPTSKFRSMLVVVKDEQLPDVLQLLRDAREGSTGFYEERFPYMQLSGRNVARLEREASGQEILLMGAASVSKKEAEPIDFGARQALLARHSIDLIALDVSEAEWQQVLADNDNAVDMQLFKSLKVNPVS